MRIIVLQMHTLSWRYIQIMVPRKLCQIMVYRRLQRSPILNLSETLTAWSLEPKTKKDILFLNTAMDQNHH